MRASFANQSMAKALTTFNAQQVQHVTSPDEAFRLMTDNVQLFPHATFMVMWEPYKILKSNVDYVVKKCQLFVTPSDVADGKCIAFSFASVLRVELGIRLDLEYYGVTDWKILVQHALTALDYIAKCSPLYHWAEDKHAISVLIYCPHGIDRDEIGKFLKSDLGFTPGTLAAYTHYILVEMPPLPLPSSL